MLLKVYKSGFISSGDMYAGIEFKTYEEDDRVKIDPDQYNQQGSD